MAVLLCPTYITVQDANGVPVSGAKIYTYAAGTTTPKATYTTAAATVQLPNPIIADSAGRFTAWISGSYKIVVHDANDVEIDTQDNVTAFSAATSTTSSYFQSFSGTGAQTAFTLSQSMGTDPKTLLIYVNNPAAADKLGYDVQNPSAYTINGTTLTFGSAPPSGTNNIYVFAPSTLVGAAAQYADAANASATAAGNSAATATTQSGIATTQAGIATTQANLAIAAFDAFDDIFLGPKAADPTLDNDGNPLATGMLYFKTTSIQSMRVYNGSAWQDAAPITAFSLVDGDKGQVIVSGSGTVWNIDIIGQTTDSTPDAAADYVMTYDASATANKKVLLSNIATPESFSNKGYVLNRYYYPVTIRPVTSVQVFNLNRIYAAPFVVSENDTFTRIGIEVTTLSAGNARLGIYNFDNGIPTTLVADLGTVSTASTGEKEITISQVLPSGVYALCFILSINTELRLSSGSISGSFF